MSVASWIPIYFAKSDDSDGNAGSPTMIEHYWIGLNLSSLLLLFSIYYPPPWLYFKFNKLGGGKQWRQWSNGTSYPACSSSPERLERNSDSIRGKRFRRTGGHPLRFERLSGKKPLIISTIFYHILSCFLMLSDAFCCLLIQSPVVPVDLSLAISCCQRLVFAVPMVFSCNMRVSQCLAFFRNVSLLFSRRLLKPWKALYTHRLPLYKAGSKQQTRHSKLL